MRGMEERATAARGDLLDALGIFVAFVEMQIAGEEYARLAPEDFLFEKARARELFVARVLRVGIFENPARLWHAEDEARGVVHAGCDLLEVLHLRLVEISPELQVDGEQPPVRRKREREIAARLARGTPGKATFRPAERARKGHQTVVPVMVARNGEYIGVGPSRESEFVRGLGASVVFGAGRIRIDLVAPEHQHLTAPSRQ